MVKNVEDQWQGVLLTTLKATLGILASIISFDSQTVYQHLSYSYSVVDVKYIGGWVGIIWLDEQTDSGLAVY